MTLFKTVAALAIVAGLSAAPAAFAQTDAPAPTTEHFVIVGSPADAAIADKIYAAFADSAIGALNLKVWVSGGVAYVTGFADTANDQRAAIEIASAVDGVKNVHTSIAVVNG